eukprot:TRINITY_DN28596_c0_g1_i1.p1 TRINITY_DN28596_c0_g1~~TRINITY_DN28596_c0_g1_i1.p1  ORF type:complete len:119 (+),score=23.98 TRINITY_DN28596_c0_g1_i1:49-405(+)
MAATKKDVKLEDAPQHKIRLTLTSRNVKALERVCADAVKMAKENNIAIKGPVRLPTKFLRITTRKTPCGEGSKTWDRFEMRIHKRLVDLHASAEVINQLFFSKKVMQPGVEIEVTISN